MSKFAEAFKGKHVELTSAAIMIAVGIAIVAGLQDRWWQILGTTLATLGGALFSYSTSSLDSKEKARKVLQSELQVTTRHLGDITGKISRTVQANNNGEVDAEKALDRISQFTTSLYGVVNDLHLVCGSAPSFKNLSDTVKGWEELTKELQRHLNPDSAGEAPDATQMDVFRQQLESLQLQISSTAREIEEPDAPKRQEWVTCPECGAREVVLVGTTRGDSGINTCSQCKHRYHVHRGADGKVFSRMWGGRTGIDVECPECGQNLPLTLKEGMRSDWRFCMNCYYELTISSDGEILDKKPGHPTGADLISSTGSRPILRCPDCGYAVQAILWDSEGCKAVCRSCHLLLESRRGISDESAQSDSAA